MTNGAPVVAFDLLSELVPQARVIGLLVNPSSLAAERTILLRCTPRDAAD